MNGGAGDAGELAIAEIVFDAGAAIGINVSPDELATGDDLVVSGRVAERIGAAQEATSGIIRICGLGDLRAIAADADALQQIPIRVENVRAGDAIHQRRGLPVQSVFEISNGRPLAIRFVNGAAAAVISPVEGAVEISDFSRAIVRIVVAKRLVGIGYPR